jgi:drug/metabolite transporter (DMT)-like permease
LSTKLKKRLSELGLIYAAAIWGSTFIIVKDALSSIDPMVLVGYRFLLAAFALGIFCHVTGRPLLKNLSHGIVLGILLWLIYIPQTVGLVITTASNSAFITGLFVAFVPVFSILLFRNKPSTLGLIGCAISLTGLWILTGGLRDINTGDLLTVICAMAYAAHILMTDKYVKADEDPYLLSFQQFLFVGIFATFSALVFGKPFAAASSQVYLVILFLAVFPTLSAFLIQVVAQKHTAPVKVSLIFAFEPVFAAAFAWTLGGETMVTHRAMGGLLIFIAIVIASLPEGTILRKVARLRFK